MENSGKGIIVPTIEEIVGLNCLFISTTGGFFNPPDNLRNTSSLKWALEVIRCPSLFGIDPYPTLPEKASLLAWTIINDHVFNDGNKRTGLATIRITILDNGCEFNISNDEIVAMARDIANYRKTEVTKPFLADWIADCMKA